VEKRRKEVPADFSMQATHAIHCPAPADGEIRHVETLRRVIRILAAQGKQVAEFYAEFLLGIITKVLLNERRIETVKAGSYCRVSGEEIAARVAASATSKGCPVSSMKFGRAPTPRRPRDLHSGDRLRV
jgi:hypothetical protein